MVVTYRELTEAVWNWRAQNGHDSQWLQRDHELATLVAEAELMVYVRPAKSRHYTLRTPQITLHHARLLLRELYFRKDEPSLVRARERLAKVIARGEDARFDFDSSYLPLDLSPLGVRL